MSVAHDMGLDKVKKRCIHGKAAAAQLACLLVTMPLSVNHVIPRANLCVPDAAKVCGLILLELLCTK